MPSPNQRVAYKLIDANCDTSIHVFFFLVVSRAVIEKSWYFQKFRIRRMTGYTAVYSVVNQDSIQKYLDDVEEELDDSVHDGLAIHNPIFINDD